MKLSEGEKRLAERARLIEKCKRKQRYPSERAARRMARKRMEWSGHELKAYMCLWCDRWHLTSNIDPF